MYASGYPICHTFDSVGINPIDYTVFWRGQVIHTGRVYPRSSTDIVTINLAPIVREYIDVRYEYIFRYVANNTFDIDVISAEPPTTERIDNIASDGLIRVESTANVNGQAAIYQAAYNYNTDYIVNDGLPSSMTTNNFIEYEIDPRQYLFVTQYKLSPPSSYIPYINGSALSTHSISDTTYNALMVNLKPAELIEGDIFSVYSNGSNITYDFKVIKPCPQRFVVYYINKAGGLDFIICKGTSIESWNPDREEVRLYNDRAVRYDFEQQYIYQELDKRYQLNTGLLTDEQAKKIDELIYSPKIWLHNLDEDTITACLITNTSYSIKSYKPNRIVQYTFNLKESQKYLRL